MEDVRSQQGVLEALSAQEGSDWKSTLEATPSRVADVGEEEPGSSSWNFSFEDLQQVVTVAPPAQGQWWGSVSPTARCAPA